MSVRVSCEDQCQSVVILQGQEARKGTEAFVLEFKAVSTREGFPGRPKETAHSYTSITDPRYKFTEKERDVAERYPGFYPGIYPG